MHGHYEDLHVHKDQRDRHIRGLADRFPKAFFAVPAYRLPLKLKIVDDLVKETDLGRDVLEQIVGWYCSHYSYRNSLLVGRTRIDLDGKKAGTVTLKEQEDARKANIDDRIKQAKTRKLAELAETAEEKATRLTARRILDSATNGATPVSKPTPPRSPPLHPALVAMQDAVIVVDGIMHNEQYGALRPVLVGAALRDIIARAEKLIAEVAIP